MNWSALFISSGVLLGIALGANDASNVFGTAVGTRVIKFRTAAIICAVFVIIGAVVDGRRGIGKLGEYAAANNINTGLAAFLVILSAAVTLFTFTALKLPVSTSQCVVGAIIGWGLSSGNADFSKTMDFVAAWVITPVGAMIICFALCKIYSRFIERRISALEKLDVVIKYGYIAFGALAAYSLGANNVANATGVFLHVGGVVDSAFTAALIGGLAIAIGVVAFSKPLMMLIGEGLTPLTNITGLIVVVSTTIIVYIFALTGIPVSTSQAVIGAVFAAGLTKGVRTVKYGAFLRVAVAWFATPVIPALLSFICGKIFAG